MCKLKNMKQNILIVFFSILLSGCGGGATTSTPTTTEKSVQSGQLRDSSTEKPLANVIVSIGESSTTTDSNGLYTLSNLPTNEEVVINFEKEGYLFGSTHIQLKSLSGDNTVSSNYLEYTMHAHDKQWNYDSSEEISDSNIAIDASVAYIDAEGNTYSGPIRVDLTILDITTTEGKTLFPGTFKGINTNGAIVPFDSYGLIHISLKDSNNNKLNLADGETATLIFNEIPSLKEQSTIPLWYYNYEKGSWIEEGYAELQVDGRYKGEISHPGTWSLNRPIEGDPGIYRGRIAYTDGTPAQDVRIYALGDNWSSNDLSIDEDGIFELEVIPESSFQLKAYNYKDKYVAYYNGTIAAIASGEIVED